MAYVINDSCIQCGSCAGQCPVGAISEGDGKFEINADTCISCGDGLLTDPVPATSSDNCYLPPGFGSKLNTNSSTAVNSTEVPQLVAERCSNGTYGSCSRSYGLEPHPCQVRHSTPAQIHLTS